MSEKARPRVARVYTAARRHPWVLGRLGDWVIWFGPYTPAQLVVMGGGALLLIKTFHWWSWLGPIPIVAWGVSIWAVRGAKIGGRSPFAAACGWIVLLAQPAAGRIAGRTARDRRPTVLHGRFVIEPARATAGFETAALAPVPCPRPAEPAAAARPKRRRAAGPVTVPAPPAPVSGLAQLLRTAQANQSPRGL